MFYEEKVVSGVLCHRSTPDGEWVQYTPESLTKAVVTLRSVADDRGEQVIKLMDKLLKIRSEVSKL